MKRLASRKWLVPLALALIVGGVSLGLGVQRLASEEKPRPGQVVQKLEGHLSELQKDASFTLYAPTELPPGFVEVFSLFQKEADGFAYAHTDYRNDASRSIITVFQTTTSIDRGEDYVSLDVGGKTVWFGGDDWDARPDIIHFLWQEGDVYVSVSVMLRGGMTEEDAFPIIASFAPVSSQAETGP